MGYSIVCTWPLSDQDSSSYIYLSIFEIVSVDDMIKGSKQN